MAARSRESCEATSARAAGVVWSRISWPHHPVRSIKGGFAGFFLMSRPPLLLLRRGARRTTPLVFTSCVEPIRTSKALP